MKLWRLVMTGRPEYEDVNVHDSMMCMKSQCIRDLRHPTREFDSHVLVRWVVFRGWWDSIDGRFQSVNWMSRLDVRVLFGQLFVGVGGGQNGSLMGVSHAVHDAHEREM